MKKINFLLLSVLLAITACNPIEVDDNGSSTIRGALQAGVPLSSKYFDLLVAEEPMFAHFQWTDYDNQTDSGFVKHRGFDQPYIYSLNTSSEQIVWKNKMPQVNVGTSEVEFLHTTTLGKKLSSDAVSADDEWSTFKTTVKVPTAKPIKILSPDMSYWKGIYPWACSEGFVLEWEADPQNKNGVVIITSWNGLIIDSDTTGGYIDHATLVKDNGYVVLDPKMFEGMPETAFVTLYMLRANIEDLEIDCKNVPWVGKDPVSYLSNSNMRKLSQNIHYASGAMSEFSFVLTYKQ